MAGRQEVCSEVVVAGVAVVVVQVWWFHVQAVV